MNKYFHFELSLVFNFVSMWCVFHCLINHYFIVFSYVVPETKRKGDSHDTRVYIQFRRSEQDNQ